jgi:hypothetical protein
LASASPNIAALTATGNAMYAPVIIVIAQSCKDLIPLRRPDIVVMKTVHLHVDGAGTVWAIAKCRTCGEVHTFRVADAIKSSVNCRSCGRPMDMQGATIEAVEASDVAKDPPSKP